MMIFGFRTFEDEEREDTKRFIEEAVLYNKEFNKKLEDLEVVVKKLGMERASLTVKIRAFLNK